jgi:gamma-glutamylcyclotransferase (GGCT)/AIG2-like uncharacterized protein YtfP
MSAIKMKTNEMNGNRSQQGGGDTASERIMAERLKFLETPRTINEFRQFTGLVGGAAYAWLYRAKEKGLVERLPDGRWVRKWSK